MTHRQLLVVLLLLSSLLSGLPFSRKYLTKTIFPRRSTSKVVGFAALSNSTPNSERARLVVHITGKHATNPLFRAELKKELTFFRGCGATFDELGPELAIITTEGRTTQLDKFLQWLKAFSVELTQRKPSFQSPSLIIYIRSLQWQDFKGDLSGFVTSNAPRSLEAVAGEGMMEARNMMGTDESV